MVEDRPNMSETMLGNINTVFIDLDDTIWDFTNNSKIALRYVYDCYEISKKDIEYKDFIDKYESINTKLWELYHYGKIEKDYLVNERFRYALAENGYNEENLQSLACDMNIEYLDYLSKLPNIVPGAKELLQYLSNKYSVGVLSNGFKGIQAQKLKSGKLDKYIDLVVLSDEVGITKPLKGIFDYAIKARNANPKQTIMIGDNYDADICGANNAGWKTIFFNRKKLELDENIADATVDRLEDIMSII
ncbi:MAG: YjjG family noncanonical pyrimidine nucleotidase [Muribaculaceae bacterium]|nr:YjjG family noncanonical pyrimidine nucleotidase [Muribaculaceae bacterium]